MAKALAELLDEGVTGRYVLVRSDLNVPLKDGVVTDDGRVRASLPVIEKLAKAGARVIVTAHLGRPKGQVDPQYSIAPAAARLAELASVPVKVATDLVGEDAKAKAADLKDGEVLVFNLHSPSKYCLASALMQRRSISDSAIRTPLGMDSSRTVVFPIHLPILA